MNNKERVIKRLMDSRGITREQAESLVHAVTSRLEETLREATDRFEKEVLEGSPTVGPPKGFLLGQWNGCTPTCGATCRARCDKNPEL